MKRSEHDPAAYGERMAEVYDGWFAVPDDAEDAASFLSELAGEGPALELGIGTGRVALPLAKQGVEVRGIDASEAMVTKLRQKPGGKSIPVSIGDFANVDVVSTFSLIYIVYNTFFALPTQEEQLRCFTNVARRLGEDGVFVVEAFMPDITLYDRGQRIGVSDLRSDRVVLEAALHDPVNQLVVSNQLILSGDGVKVYPVRLRYTWPSELDLMARLVGLRLRERCGGWQREPFTAESRRHVSVYDYG